MVPENPASSAPQAVPEPVPSVPAPEDDTAEGDASCPGSTAVPASPDDENDPDSPEMSQVYARRQAIAYIAVGLFCLGLFIAFPLVRLVDLLGIEDMLRRNGLKHLVRRYFAYSLAVDEVDAEITGGWLHGRTMRVKVTLVSEVSRADICELLAGAEQRFGNLELNHIGLEKIRVLLRGSIPGGGDEFRLDIPDRREPRYPENEQEHQLLCGS